MGESLCGVCAGSGVRGHVVTWCLAFGNHEGCSSSKSLSTLAAVCLLFLAVPGEWEVRSHYNFYFHFSNDCMVSNC